MFSKCKSLFSSDYSNELTREEKLNYLNVRLKDYELHAFMSLAIELEVYQPDEQDITTIFEMITLSIISYYTWQNIDWIDCPLHQIRREKKENIT